VYPIIRGTRIVALDCKRCRALAQQRYERRQAAAELLATAEEEQAKRWQRQAAAKRGRTESKRRIDRRQPSLKRRSDGPAVLARAAR